MPKERICVIIRHRHNLSDTLACLHSLSQACHSRCTILVLHDTHVTDLDRHIRAKFPQILLSPTNVSLQSAASYNIGIQWALSKPFSWILLLSNESIVDPNFLSAFHKEREANPQTKIFGAKILDVNDPTQVLHLGGTWDAKHAIYNSFCHNTASIDYVSLHALFMHRSVPQTIGYFEPKYQLFWEDIDFCYRARRKGFLVHIAPTVKIWCKASLFCPKHDSYFWFYGRLLWMQRNLTEGERRKVYKQIIRPELQKNLYEIAWLLLLRLFFCTTKKQREKYRQLRAKIGAWIHASLHHCQ